MERVSIFSYGKIYDILVKKRPGGRIMSVDVLQEKIRKVKNPSMVDFSVDFSAIPTQNGRILRE